MGVGVGAFVGMGVGVFVGSGVAQVVLYTTSPVQHRLELVGICPTPAHVVANVGVGGLGVDVGGLGVGVLVGVGMGVEAVVLQHTFPVEHVPLPYP